MITPPDSLNSKQALFIREHATGIHKSAAAACIVAGYTPTRARQTACAILARPDAKDYLAAIHNEIEAAASITRNELAEFYADIIRAKPSQASESNPLCEKVEIKDGTEYHFPGKLAAANALKVMMGWDKPVEDGPTKLADALGAIFKKRDI